MRELNPGTDDLTPCRGGVYFGTDWLDFKEGYFIVTKSVFSVLALVLLPGVLCADVLYDPSQGTLPSAQGWLYLTDPLFGASATRNLVPGAVSLDTTPDTDDSAGFFSTAHPGMPVLERSTGYTVSFNLRVGEETHGSVDRAGFSVLVLSEDSLGIELGFWENEIWAQSGADFHHAESVTFDTTAAPTDYDLVVLGSTYTLMHGGTSLLSGGLRDYSAHPHPVYSSTSFLFFGDDTGSAAARAELGTVSVTVPEPASLLLLTTVALVVARRRRAR